MKQLPYFYRWIVWNTSKLFIASCLKPTYRFRLTSKPPVYPKPPFVAVANHGTFFDPWIIGWYSPYPFSYMINDDGFRGRSISSWYLKNIGGIPKKKGASDYKAMKTTFQYLKKGNAVGIFPEGQTSWDGETQPVFPGLEKIVKKVNCNLVLIKLQGNFLTKPWWAKKTRNGRVLISFRQINSSQILKYSSDEIFDIYKEYITHSDIKDPQNLNYPFKGEQLAEGLERFVWICINCGCEDTLVTENNSIICTSCGKSWIIDAHCRLFPRSENTKSLHDLKDWSDWHKMKVKEKIKAKPEVLTQSQNVILQTENEQGLFTNKAVGTLILSPNHLTFCSSSQTYNWITDNLTNCVIQKKDIFEFSYENKLFRFLFDKKSVMKWIFYTRYLKGFEEIEKRGYF
ncbi:MAG TPA: lysophospholipid acyltransferase family protein [Chitinispirillaceae bacterium]|nr:lysophospholipid acyltransferase family protein [Chitinispirillaceae bacterium]